MDMPDEWVAALRVWASRNDSVRELWLFGSRAKGCSQSDSDVDLALVLMPANGKHDWAGGAFLACHKEWKRQLEDLVGRHVSLEAMEPGTHGDVEVRRSGIRLWTRDP